MKSKKCGNCKHSDAAGFGKISCFNPKLMWKSGSFLFPHKHYHYDICNLFEEGDIYYCDKREEMHSFMLNSFKGDISDWKREELREAYSF